MAAEGQQDREVGRRLRAVPAVGRHRPTDDELFATLTALTGYYAARADLHRLAQVLELLRASLEEGRQWFRPVIDVESGVLAWLRGEFDAAAFHFEQATADPAAADRDQIDAVWFVPSEPIVTAHLHLGWAHMVRGDFTGAEAELARAACRANELAFPQVRSCTPTRGSSRSGSASKPVGSTEPQSLPPTSSVNPSGTASICGSCRGPPSGPSSSVLAALGADDVPSGLSAHIATLTTLLDTWRALG